MKNINKIKETKSVKLDKKEIYAILDLGNIIKEVECHTVKDIFPHLTEFLVEDANNHLDSLYLVNCEHPEELIKQITSVEGNQNIDPILEDGGINNGVEMRCSYADLFGVFKFSELIADPKVKFKNESDFKDNYEAIILKEYVGKISILTVENELGSDWNFLIGENEEDETKNFILIIEQFNLYCD